MRDSEIEQWVLNEIKVSTGGRSREVCVLSLNGVVDLRGTVHSRAERQAVQEAAHGSKGVLAVINQLKIRKSGIASRRRARVKRKIPTVSGTFHLPTNTPLGSSQAAN